MNTNVSKGWLRMFVPILLSLLLLVSGALPALAEAAKKGRSAKVPDTVTVKVSEVVNVREKDKDRAGLGDKIIVKVDSLKSLLSLAGNNLDRIRLTIDGQEINTPSPIRTGDDNTLQLTLVRDDRNTRVLDSLFVNKEGLLVNVQVSLLVDEPLNKKILDVRPVSFKLVRSSPVTVKVLDVTNARKKNKDRAGIGDHIIVKVDSLKSLLSLAGNNLDKIRLTIDGEKINTPAPVRTGDENTLQFILNRDDPNIKALDALFDKKQWQMVTSASVSLSVDDLVKKKIQDVRPFSFRLVRPTNFNGMLFTVALVLFAISFLKLGNLDARLRDYGPDSTYSLARVQMAVWYYVVTLSFLYLYVSSGFCMPELNQSTMVLLGISSATALGGKIVNVSNKKQEKDAGTAPVTEANVGKSDWILMDILTDEYGINLTRFQIVLWTLIMVGIFVFTVVTESVIPDFSDSNLLLLMGISSGSYLGYKLKEAPPPEPKKS